MARSRWLGQMSRSWRTWCPWSLRGHGTICGWTGHAATATGRPHLLLNLLLLHVLRTDAASILRLMSWRSHSIVWNRRWATSRPHDHLSWDKLGLSRAHLRPHHTRPHFFARSHACRSDESSSHLIRYMHAHWRSHIGTADIHWLRRSVTWWTLLRGH